MGVFRASRASSTAGTSLVPPTKSSFLRQPGPDPVAETAGQQPRWVRADEVFEFPSLFEIRCKQATALYPRGTEPSATGNEVVRQAGDNVIRYLSGLARSSQVLVRQDADHVSVFDWKWA